MNKIPEILKMNNKDNFTNLNYDRILCLLRKEIYIHVINYEDTHDENDYFDIDAFCEKYDVVKFTKKYCDNDKTSSINKMVNSVIEELKELGWKCKLSFNDTGLFIYSTENTPPSCW